ncbi:MAG: NAD(P)/FAD-dependent oxidoreductase [Candidatus Bathyarchaeota archaeon]|nr:NAD(P)/FAD-dependent oxidoreductase [Candidatus Bathyarchaeota archaeon]
MNQESLDAIVVGGGPCGSSAALALAKLGVDVAVFEEHKEIGLPSHCAGHVSLNGLKRLGLRLPRRIFENKINGAVFYSPSGSEFRVKRSSPVTCVLNRELLDKHLAELAMKAGVRFLTGLRVNSLVLKSGVVVGVSVSRKQAKETIASKIVIDAEGCSSLLLKRVGLQTLDRSMVVNAIQAEVDKVSNVDSNMVEVYLGQKYAPGLFAWVIPKRDGSDKVGLATKRGDPREYLRRFMQKHPVASKRFMKSKIASLSMHPISLGGAIPKTYANGLLVVGDAASQVKPTTGGGIIFGLLCARIAGEVAYEAIENRDFSEKFLSRYQFQWRKLIGFDLAMMLRLRKMLNRLSDDEMDKIINLCTKLEINKVLEEAGDEDFMGSSLIRMLPHPAALTTALYFLFYSVTSHH